MNTARRLPLVNRTNSDELQELQELCFSSMKKQKTPVRRSRKDEVQVHQKAILKASDETASTVSISSLSSFDENFLSAKVDMLSFTPTCNQPWATPSENVASKAVFFRHLIGPAIKVQTAVRGWIQIKKYREQQKENLRLELIQLESQAATVIQAVFRGFQSRKMLARTQATISIQSMARRFFARQRRQLYSLEAKLRNIQHCHRVELEKIESNKQCEMKRIYNEIMASMQAEEKRLQEVHQSRLQLIAELKESNSQLREDNETLLAASLDIAQTNQRSMALLDHTKKNIKELQRFLPKVQADLAKHQAEAAEWQQGLEEFEKALEAFKERRATEKKIRKTFQITTLRLVQAIREGCSDAELAKSIVQMAKKKRKTTSV
jgi:signal transduction histidine kinase